MNDIFIWDFVVLVILLCLLWLGKVVHIAASMVLSIHKIQCESHRLFNLSWSDFHEFIIIERFGLQNIFIYFYLSNSFSICCCISFFLLSTFHSLFWPSIFSLFYEWAKKKPRCKNKLITHRDIIRKIIWITQNLIKSISIKTKTMSHLKLMSPVKTRLTFEHFNECIVQPYAIYYSNTTIYMHMNIMFKP